MSGTHEGALKGAATYKLRYGVDAHRANARKAKGVPKTKPAGFAYMKKYEPKKWAALRQQLAETRRLEAGETNQEPTT